MNNPSPYYPCKQHKILADKETGSRYWAIAGEFLQFTWFEVSPYSSFRKHSHASEQITYVLEGALFFEIDSKIYKISAGDCILIPSHKEHTVWTGDVVTKAVDAWSPLNEKYLSN